MRAALALSVFVLQTFGLESPIEGYGVMIPQWEVEVTPGGPVVNLTGTIEEVHHQLTHLNPTWDNDFPFNATAEEERASKLAPRTDFTGANYFCGGRWPDCLAPPIVDGIRYLRRVSGRPTNGPGPGNCGRVSCSYNSAIWWCNDSADSKTLNGFESIADGADFLNNHCVKEKWEGWHYNSVISGQVFHHTNWNVIVRKDTDNC